MTTAKTEITPPADDAAELLDRVRATTDMLEWIANDWRQLDGIPAEDRERLHQAVARVYHPDPVARRKRIKARERERRAAGIQREEAKLHGTGIRTLRRRPVFTTPNIFPPPAFEPQDVNGEAPRETVEPRHCYVCKEKYSVVHHFYDQLCPQCAELNFRKRIELADLKGRVALLTGGRVKIGYQAGLKLLRSGAQLIVTTRFPRDSAQRYAQEPDFPEWGHRLEIFGLDLRHTPSVEAFCHELVASRQRLDFIINNACQTVRRPPDFYAHMMAGETAALAEMPAHARKLLGAYEGLRGYHMLPEAGTAVASETAGGADLAGLARAAELSQVPLLPEEHQAQKALFPEGRLDQDLQQVDLRGRNSWRMLLAEVPSVEQIGRASCRERV